MGGKQSRELENLPTEMKLAIARGLYADSKDRAMLSEYNCVINHIHGGDLPELFLFWAIGFRVNHFFRREPEEDRLRFIDHEYEQQIADVKAGKRDHRGRKIATDQA